MLLFLLEWLSLFRGWKVNYLHKSSQYYSKKQKGKDRKKAGLFFWKEWEKIHAFFPVVLLPLLLTSNCRHVLHLRCLSAGRPICFYVILLFFSEYISNISLPNNQQHIFLLFNLLKKSVCVNDFFFSRRTYRHIHWFIQLM